MIFRTHCIAAVSKIMIDKYAYQIERSASFYLSKPPLLSILISYGGKVKTH